LHKLKYLTYGLEFLQQMENEWVRSDCLTVGGFPPLLWETLQRLGYTEPPMYYGREEQEDGVPKCEVRLRIPKHPACPNFKARRIAAHGRELYDTCQKAALQALADYCQIFEEDIEHTPARFFPVLNQTTPTWRLKIQDLEKVGQRMPDAILPATVRYLHALDYLYEEQRQELKVWKTRARKMEEELGKVKLELSLANEQKVEFKRKLAACRQEKDELMQDPYIWKRAKRMKEERTFAMSPHPKVTADLQGQAPPYDPRHPHFDLNEYFSRESFSDHESIKTEESVADNLRYGWIASAEPSRAPSGQGDNDGYAHDR
jgi:hypothetical protein